MAAKTFRDGIMPTNQVINDVEPRTQLVVMTPGQTVFNVSWTADAAASVLVYARADGVAADDATQLVSSSDYSVTFIGTSATVRVTFSSGRTLDDLITIVRSTDSERTNLYINTNFTPSMLNTDFGIETMVQQQNEMYARKFAPHYNFSCTYTDNTDTEIDLILPVLEANQVWIKNPGNTAITTATLSGSGIGVETVSSTANEILVDNSDVVNPIIGLSPTIDTPGTFTIQGGTVLSGIIDDNTMASATNANISTSKAIKAYVDSASGGDVDSVTGTVNEIDVGGTAADPVLSLSATLNAPGTFQIQASAVALDGIINDNSMATASATNIATAESIKAYVDNVAGSGFTVVLTCLLGTTANLTGTYVNGAAGVGATLTNNSTQVALTIDGVLTQVGDRILVKDQTSTPDNGVYEVTTVGTGATDWVITRVTDYDEAAEILPGTLVPVSSGTVNGGSIYLETATVTTVGTDPIVFAIFAQPANTFVTLATVQTISGAKTFSNDVTLSGGSFLDLNGSTAIDGFNDDNTFATASATTGATSKSIKAYIDANTGGGGNVGDFVDFGGTSAPAGCLVRNGNAVSRTTYAALFAVIGTAFGAGDGATTFNLPDSQRRVSVGSGGTGTATLGNAVGDTGGAETHTLTTGEMPAHTHNWGGIQSQGFSGGNTIFATSGSGSTTTSTGGGGAHDNIQPSLVILPCIRFEPVAATVAAAASQSQMEAAASSAVFSAPAVQQFHPGHPKGWVEYNQVSNTVLASYNVTSVTDTSVGDFTVNWDTDFSSANYSACMSTIATGGGINPIHIGVFTTGGTVSIAAGSIRCVVKSDVTPVDVEFNSVVAFGDQA
jgi:microcystin-dependent protein